MLIVGVTPSAYHRCAIQHGWASQPWHIWESPEPGLNYCRVDDGKHCVAESQHGHNRLTRLDLRCTGGCLTGEHVAEEQHAHPEPPFWQGGRRGAGANVSCRRGPGCGRLSAFWQRRGGTGTQFARLTTEGRVATCAPRGALRARLRLLASTFISAPRKGGDGAANMSPEAATLLLFGSRRCAAVPRRCRRRRR